MVQRGVSSLSLSLGVDMLMHLIYDHAGAAGWEAAEAAEGGQKHETLTYTGAVY